MVTTTLRAKGFDRGQWFDKLWQIKTWNRGQPPLRHIYIYSIRKKDLTDIAHAKNNVAKHVDTCKTCTMALILWCHSSLNSFGNGTNPFFFANIQFHTWIFVPQSPRCFFLLFRLVYNELSPTRPYFMAELMAPAPGRNVSPPLRWAAADHIWDFNFATKLMPSMRVWNQNSTGHLPPIIVQIITLK